MILRRCFRAWAPLAFLAPIALCAEELQPRAYLPAPVGMNFLSISYSSNSGGLLFDPSLPVENGNLNASIPSVAFGETLGVFGRASQVLAVFAVCLGCLEWQGDGCDTVPA